MAHRYGLQKVVELASYLGASPCVGPVRSKRTLDGRPKKASTALLALALTLGLAIPVAAADVTYWNGQAVSGVFATSATASIRGGSVTSACGVLFCTVEVRTTYSFYPYYVYASAVGPSSTSLTHSLQTSMRSRCKHNFNGPGTTLLTCKYKT